MANLVMMGNLYTVDNPDSEGADSRPVETKMSILIQFESADELRKAIEDKKVEFTVFE